MKNKKTLKKCSLITIKIILLCLSCLIKINAEALNLGFGKCANSIIVNLAEIPEPPLSKTKKSFVTQNNFGFDVVNSESNWVIKSFLKGIKKNNVVMDVGAGYGALTRSALGAGAIVINNEISENQQLYSLKFLNKEQKKRLFFQNNDVRNLVLNKGVLDKIIFHRVLHFFKGQEIETLLKKSYDWLKPGGKIYIVMMSKDHIAFRDKIDYDLSKKWPGEDLVVVSEHLPEQAYALPPTLHVMSIDTLQTALQKIGFEIEKADYVSLQKLGTEANRDGKEAIGIIAIKK
jgi:SAM-dependent methyltransferase